MQWHKIAHIKHLREIPTVSSHTGRWLHVGYINFTIFCQIGAALRSRSGRNQGCRKCFRSVEKYSPIPGEIYACGSSRYHQYPIMLSLREKLALPENLLSLLWLKVFTFTHSNGLDTCYSATYMSQTRDQQRFTISEVAANWHEPTVPQRIMWPSIARANGQLDPRCR